MCVREKYHRKTGAFLGFEAYVHLRTYKTGNDVQRYKTCPTRELAEKAEKVLIREAAEALKVLDGRGSHWGALCAKWEAEAKVLKRNPATLKPMNDKALINALSILRTWTKDWMETPANELSIKHGKELLLSCISEDLKPATIRKIKTTINLVFRYGVQEGIIHHGKTSPVHGVPFDLDDGDIEEEILTVDEVKKLLAEAKKQEHPWYRIWAVALMTGMRSSELYALRKENVFLKESYIRVRESWDWVNDCAKCTKAGYWRTAPIASALRPIIEELMSQNPESPFMFPRFIEWERQYQAMVLREFCQQIGIRSVRFHTLRACFATHLLAMGVDQASIMAIGGWSNLKTFRIYVRLAGVTEKSKTEGLGNLFVPPETISRAFEPQIVA
jgi:integrase